MPTAKPTMVDELAADTKAADETPEYPEGAPEFYLLHRMPYRQRAEATRRYDSLQAYLKAHPELTKGRDDQEKAEDEDVEVDLTAAADSYEMIARMDEFMESAAVDRSAYHAWPDRLNADVFIKTWSAYQAAAQTGEASSSAS